MPWPSANHGPCIMGLGKSSSTGKTVNNKSQMAEEHQAPAAETTGPQAPLWVAWKVVRIINIRGGGAAGSALPVHFPGLTIIHPYDEDTNPFPYVSYTSVCVCVCTCTHKSTKECGITLNHSTGCMNVGIYSFSEMHPWDDVDLCQVWIHMAPSQVYPLSL